MARRYFRSWHSLDHIWGTIGSGLAPRSHQGRRKSGRQNPETQKNRKIWKKSCTVAYQIKALVTLVTQDMIKTRNPGSGKARKARTIREKHYFCLPKGNHPASSQKRPCVWVKCENIIRGSKSLHFEVASFMDAPSCLESFPSLIDTLRSCTKEYVHDSFASLLNTLHYEINLTTSLKKAKGPQKGQISLLILNPHVIQREGLNFVCILRPPLWFYKLWRSYCISLLV